MLSYNEDDNVPCEEGGGEAPCEEDNNMPCDDTMLNILFPNASIEMLDFFRTQSKCCRNEVAGRDSRGRRWPKSVLSLALSLWIASPAAYRILKCKLCIPAL